jgi:hypothetical protein
MNSIRTWVRLCGNDQQFLCTLGTACVLLAILSFWIARIEDYVTRNPYMSEDIPLQMSMRY